MIWLPPIIVAGLLATYLLSKYGEKLKGKKLAIIGLAASGKTTLAEYLANNCLPEETSSTIFVKEYEKRTLKDLEMKVCITDSKANHTKYDYAQEIEILCVSDIILYLFNMSELFKAEGDKYFKRIRKEILVYSNELKNLQSTIDGKPLLDKAKDLYFKYNPHLDKIKTSLFGSEVCPPSEKIFIALGTFSDKINEDELKLTKNEIDMQFATIEKKLKELFKESFQDITHYEILCSNSLVNSSSADIMVNNIFKVLKKHYSWGVI